ncbi:protein translocase subunit SecD [Petrocella sp. FN5]|uniref:protein translocase subunit SecD n=1 Tax=Petrocella sp. FN5 TaxID=3032002 RepID=UPI0023DCEB96|nr:protein translocase subunit SecD [Petrocella sp. FN5]MDF1617667.1 protein translocase subunit SecD [Petrocella sp. FN5]
MKGKYVVALIISLVLIVGTAYVAIVGVGENKNGSVEEINLGLDLEGGVSITYAPSKADPTSVEIQDTLYKLQLRLDEYGYTEGEVYLEGSSRINVDIPGVKNADQVLLEMGKPGKLAFIDEDGIVWLTGADVKNAEPGTDTSGMTRDYVVHLEFTPDGVTKFAEATTKNVGKPLYIYYNDEPLLAPTVNEPILNGQAVINNMGSLVNASQLAANIRIGALPLELIELRSNVVGAKMGQDAIRTSILAGLIGISLVFLFMIGFYRLPGVVSSIALIFYASLMIVSLSLFNVTLTLPGIAGIILSIGMAVDANVIIFSRIKEEIGSGKTLKASVKSGFKKATSAIVDGNATTLIAAIVLYIMGTGTIKGFAITLMIGIAVSMFTSLVMTRLLLSSLVGMGLRDKKLYGVDLGHKSVQVIEKRKVFFAVSVVIILIGLVMMPVNQATRDSFLNFDIEFVGGTSTLVSVGAGQGYLTPEALQEAVKDLVVEATGQTTPQFQNVTGKDEFIIKTPSLTSEERLALSEALIEKYNITSDDIESESISATVSGEMRRDAIIAVLVASLCILIYVSFRFKDFWFGMAAVVALVHDIFIVFAVYSIGNVPINNSFIAAMLTIVGYSINDTIVVFDRIRENMSLERKFSYKDLINMSISQTMGRSINTSLTTFIMVGVLYIVGVTSIREFALPLMIGILSGTYSSIFIASPMWYIFKINHDKKLKKKIIE